MRRGVAGQRGFTVVELLVVLAVIGLLSTLLLPTWSDAVAEARNAQCAEGMRQLGRAAAVYGADHDGRFPGSQHTPPPWVTSLASYTSAKIFVCPLELPNSSKIASGSPAPRRASWTYALNDFLIPNPFGARDANFSTFTSIASPSQTIFFGEAAEDFRAYDHFHFADGVESGYSPGAFVEQVDAERHSGTANYLFVEGRVENLGWSSGAKPKLTARGSRFVHPDGLPFQRPVHTAFVAP